MCRLIQKPAIKFCLCFSDYLFSFTWEVIGGWENDISAKWHCYISVLVLLYGSCLCLCIVLSVMVLSEIRSFKRQVAKFGRNESWNEAKQEHHLLKKWLLSRWILYTGKELKFWVVWVLAICIESHKLDLQLKMFQQANQIFSHEWLVTTLPASSLALASAPGRRRWGTFWSLPHWCRNVSAPGVPKSKAFQYLM